MHRPPRVPPTAGMTASVLDVLRQDIGAGDGDRTRDFNLGKVALTG
jgi:hypothetical protein